MKRTMSEKDFTTFKELASKYSLTYEIIDRTNGWVCIYIGD